jgi:hypothetical protein
LNDTGIPGIVCIVVVKILLFDIVGSWTITALLSRVSPLGNNRYMANQASPPRNVLTSSRTSAPQLQTYPTKQQCHTQTETRRVSPPPSRAYQECISRHVGMYRLQEKTLSRVGVCTTQKKARRWCGELVRAPQGGPQRLRWFWIWDVREVSSRMSRAYRGLHRRVAERYDMQPCEQGKIS